MTQIGLKSPLYFTNLGELGQEKRREPEVVNDIIYGP